MWIGTQLNRMAKERRLAKCLVCCVPSFVVSTSESRRLIIAVLLIGAVRSSAGEDTTEGLLERLALQCVCSSVQHHGRPWPNGRARRVVDRIYVSAHSSHVWAPFSPVRLSSYDTQIRLTRHAMTTSTQTCTACSLIQSATPCAM